EYFMQQAYDQALIAYNIGEVPIGAVLVKDSKVVSVGYNQTITNVDPTAHAEIVAIRSAAKILSNHRLVGTKLYVTMEPCIMCFGAIVQARVSEIIYACDDSRVGALSKENYHLNANVNHNTTVTGGVLHQECSDLLKKFF
ncbi:hypothetical protein EGW08_023689, partial [Elysia chlorotica]